MFVKVFRYSRTKNALTPLTPAFLLLLAALFIAPFFNAFLYANQNWQKASELNQKGDRRIAQNRFDEAPVVFEQGKNSSKEDVAAQSAFWKGYLLGKRMNRPSDALPLVQEGYNRGYRDSFVEFFLKKYSGSAVSERSLAPDAPVTSPKTQRPIEASASPMACSHSGD